jgi:hypothetical protein
MRSVTFIAIAILFVTASADAQSKPNDAIARQLKTLGAESSITLTHDNGSNMSKLMAVSENFSDAEAKSADVRAMNFAVGFFYPGETLEKSPDPILLTFWVLAKQNRFGNGHALVVQIDGETLDIGDSRYVARPRDNMEYLNFNLTRDVLAKIARGSSVKFTLGGAGFTFSKEQQRMLANLLSLSDPAPDK